MWVRDQVVFLNVVVVVELNKLKKLAIDKRLIRNMSRVIEYAGGSDTNNASVIP
jgi:hypothetical protein